MPRSAVLSVGYLWGGSRTRTCGIGARGRPRWLSQLGVQRLNALLMSLTKSASAGSVPGSRRQVSAVPLLGLEPFLKIVCVPAGDRESWIAVVWTRPVFRNACMIMARRPTLVDITVQAAHHA